MFHKSMEWLPIQTSPKKFQMPNEKREIKYLKKKKLLRTGL